MKLARKSPALAAVAIPKYIVMAIPIWPVERAHTSFASAWNCHDERHDLAHHYGSNGYWLALGNSTRSLGSEN
jgi:hypothetical protein